MWIMVEVDDPHDVGGDERARYLLSDNISIVNKLGSIYVIASGNEVHPATPSGAREHIRAIQEITPQTEIAKIIGIV